MNVKVFYVEIRGVGLQEHRQASWRARKIEIISVYTIQLIR